MHGTDLPDPLTGAVLDWENDVSVVAARLLREGSAATPEEARSYAIRAVQRRRQTEATLAKVTDAGGPLQSAPDQGGPL